MTLHWHIHSAFAKNYILLANFCTTWWGCKLSGTLKAAILAQRWTTWTELCNIYCTMSEEIWKTTSLLTVCFLVCLCVVYGYITILHWLTTHNWLNIWNENKLQFMLRIESWFKIYSMTSKHAWFSSFGV